MNSKLLIQLFILFVIVQVLGLWVGSTLIQQNVSAQVITENPDDVENSIGLLLYILIMTGIILIAIKFLKDRTMFGLFKIVEALAIWGSSVIVFSTVFNEAISVILALIIVFSRNLFPNHVQLRNLSSVLATVGAGALLGVSLGIFPVIIFLILLSVYDYIAVFKTKHMVVMAKSLTKKNLAFTFALPTKEHQFELGTGDMVMPLLFSVSALKASSLYLIFPYNFIPSILVLVASFFGLLITIDYSSKHVGKALPALPLQSAMMIGVYGLLKIVGF